MACGVPPGTRHAVTRSHPHPVHERQHRLSILRLHQLREAVTTPRSTRPPCPMLTRARGQVPPGALDQLGVDRVQRRSGEHRRLPLPLVGRLTLAEVRKPVRPYPVLAADGRNDLFEPSSPVRVRSAVPQPVPKNLSSSRSPQISVGRSQRLQRPAIALRANAARTPRRMG